ncbi:MULTISPECIES: acyl carrier protein [unclassified Flavobacterium]|uniref:acyl carrier protein n=1 Tax=unclassified Flavobacterium TaxID=196869 RepID=UPI001292B5B9|nr:MULTISPECIES: acyl carrier protein [unclassified Flavobacterium]MQP52049.1 acyl carrier protein [Flavobacterium sp. LMO9]MQP61918.1 acyl carrier protein [Flavobacterium sp. LMO6]
MEAKFLEMISDVLEIEDRTIEITDAFRDYDGWDSLARLSLIAEIDDVYNIVIEDEVFKNLITLADLYNEINKRTQA